MQVRCEQCGRAFALDRAGMGTCPSCGRAATLPTQTLAALFSAEDESATRPVPPGAGTVQTSSEGRRQRPDDLIRDDRPTAPPPPPLDALTAPAAPYEAYKPPSLPRSHVPDPSPSTAVPSGSADEGVQPYAPTPQRAGPGATSALPSTPRLDPTATLPPGLVPAQIGDGAPSDAKSGRGGRVGLRIVSAVGLLVVLILGVTGAILAANGRLPSLLGTGPTVAATPTPTGVAGPPAAPSGFHTYTANDGSYMLSVPNTWDTYSQPVGKVILTLFADPNTKSNFEIETIAGLDDPQNLDDQFINGLGPAMASKTGTSSVSGKSTPDQAPAAGILWTRESADVVVTSSGQTTAWHLVALAAQHGAQTLLIAYFAPGGSFAAVNSVDFQPMLDSLLLVSPQP